MAVTYYFTSFDESPGRGGDQCQGFNTRFFTFDKGPGGQLSPGVDVRAAAGRERMTREHESEFKP